jgi:hypothetical protein
VQDLPSQVPFTVFDIPARPNLTLYHSLVVPPGEQSNPPYTHVSVAYSQSVDGRPGNLWIAQCDQPLWYSSDVDWRTLDDLLVNEDVDGYLICRLKLHREGTYVHMESSFASLDQLIEDARNLKPILPSASSPKVPHGGTPSRHSGALSGASDPSAHWGVNPRRTHCPRHRPWSNTGPHGRH